jgi:protein-L-isoaspartate(D-aspartate) O-methyltransferase
MTPMHALELAHQLRPAVPDDRVLGAIASIPRERFVPESVRDRAYENVALPIGCGQTISQPLVVARMLQALVLRIEDRVLDIGTCGRSSVTTS